VEFRASLDPDLQKMFFFEDADEDGRAERKLVRRQIGFKSRPDPMHGIARPRAGRGRSIRLGNLRDDPEKATYPPEKATYQNDART
jgi:hypothetical protein